MLALPPPDLLNLFHIVVSRIQRGWKLSYEGQAANRAMAYYMERQALKQYYPAIHWRIDARDFMAKDTSNWNLIEYRLEDAELEAFEAWQAREKITFVQGLNYCAEKMIKVSFTFSEKDGSWCVSLTGQKDNRFNSGATLTNWSDESIDAFMMGIYKASVIFQDGKWTTRKSSRRG